MEFYRIIARLSNKLGCVPNYSLITLITLITPWDVSLITHLITHEGRGGHQKNIEGAGAVGGERKLRHHVKPNAANGARPGPPTLWVESFVGLIQGILFLSDARLQCGVKPAEVPGELRALPS